MSETIIDKLMRAAKEFEKERNISLVLSLNDLRDIIDNNIYKKTTVPLICSLEKETDNNFLMNFEIEIDGQDTIKSIKNKISRKLVHYLLQR